MIVNNKDHLLTITVGTTVAMAYIDDIVQLNRPETDIEQIQITHSPNHEEIATLDRQRQHRTQIQTGIGFGYSQQRPYSRGT